MPSGSAVRGNVHVLRVGSLQGYEVRAFTTLLRHLANFEIGAANFRFHKTRSTRSVQRFFQKLLCSNERFNDYLSIVKFSQMKGSWLWSLVMKKSGWFLWAEFQIISHVRVGVSKNSHEGGRTGAFPTATSSSRRNEQNTTRAIIEDPLVGHATRMNEQKST